MFRRWSFCVGVIVISVYRIPMGVRVRRGWGFFTFPSHTVRGTAVFVTGEVKICYWVSGNRQAARVGPWP